MRVFFLGATQLQEISHLLQITVTFKSRRRIVLRKKDELIKEKEIEKELFLNSKKNLAEF